MSVSCGCQDIVRSSEENSAKTSFLYLPDKPLFNGKRINAVTIAIKKLIRKLTTEIIPLVAFVIMLLPDDFINSVRLLLM
jgi:hypothetical protein